MLSAALELLEVVVFNRLLSLTDCINKELRNKRGFYLFTSADSPDADAQ